MGKLYVSAAVRFEADGRLRPLWIEWEDGRRYPVDRVIEVRRSASLKAGGAVIRFTCCFGQHVRYLFLEEDRWFVEIDDREDGRDLCADDTY